MKPCRTVLLFASSLIFTSMAIGASQFTSQDRDIGAVAVAGSASSDSSGTFTIYTLTGYASLDGANWTALGTTSFPMIDPILIGLAVTSHNNAALNTSMFDNVTWTSMP